MLAKNKISASETIRENDMKNRMHVAEDSKDAISSWWIKGVSNQVREAAEAAAKKQDMKLSDFLAEAIFAYAEHLEAAIDSETEDHDTEDHDDVARALQECVARIEALEKRLAVSDEHDMHRAKAMARRRVKNLVERPWLKNWK